MNIRERIESKSAPIPESGCWLWQGYTSGKEGYGRIIVNGASLRAHRVSYEAFIGPIPEGMLICHKCDTPLCVNPNHLFIGSNQDNQRDASAKGRSAGQQKTHCPHGHEYSPDNTYVKTDGHRACRECGRRRFRDWWHNRRPAAPSAKGVAP